MSGGSCFAFFHSYFDESGKLRDRKVISFCAVAVPDEHLGQFNRAWEELLRKNQLIELHAVHALRCGKRLSPGIDRGSPEDRFEALKPFVDCIPLDLDLAMAVALEVREYANGSDKAKRQIGGAEDLAYMAFLRSSLMLNDHACREDDPVSIARPPVHNGT